jgi:cyclic beta-1,2-glucan synthetase
MDDALMNPERGLILSYFGKNNDAERAIEALWRAGFRRVVRLHRKGQGEVSVYSPAVLRHRLLILASALLCLLLGLFAAMQISTWLAGWPPWLRLLGMAVIGAAGGATLGWGMANALFPGFDPLELEKQRRWLAIEEDLILVEAPMDHLVQALPILRQQSEAEPAIFPIHPLRRFTTPLQAPQAESMPAGRLREHAQTLASEQAAGAWTPSGQNLLDRTEKTRGAIHAICDDLRVALRLEQGQSPKAEWLLDNEYIIESHARDVAVNLPHKFYRELPILRSGPNKGLPRIYDIARDLVAHTDLRLSKENICDFLEAFQQVQGFKIGELWAMSLMLRVALLENLEQLARQAWFELREHEQADFWAYRLLAIARRDPDQIFSIMAELTRSQPHPSAYFAVQLTGPLYDEESALVPVRSWLERTQRQALGEINTAEQARQAAEQISIGNAISSLRQLGQLDWREIFESLSQVEQVLRHDPAGVYAQMDFDSRSIYREAVETIAAHSNAGEVETARQAIALAAAAGTEEGVNAPRRHIGWYLIGEGRSKLTIVLGCRDPLSERLRHWILRHHTLVYLTLVFASSGLLAVLPVIWLIPAKPLGLQIVATLLLAGPASQLAIEILHYLISRLLPPRFLPKMDFESGGIPDAFRTLVVVPILLTDQTTISHELEQLEIRYLANREANLLFSLFSDLPDSEVVSESADEQLLQTARQGIERLDRRYGTGRFLLFHRGRTWTESEQRYIGWERKRGKLEELNRLIAGLPGRTDEGIVAVGEAEALTAVRFVITLDSDTQLPRNSARRLIETLAHPLNQPRLQPGDVRVQGGYTIIQPRVSASLPSATATSFSRLFTNPIGTDPYTKAVSNAYQDLSGASSYLGKGIYDPRAFHQVLGDRFPEQRLLSHDLLEGAHVRVGLATDIELFDEFPPDYIGYSQREHRWMRGDWQIAEWLFPWVPGPQGSRLRNPLPLLDRWKIFDNLRRSLIPAGATALLIMAWLSSPALTWLAYALIGGLLLFQPLAQSLTWATTPAGVGRFTGRQAGIGVARALVQAAMLPYQAGMALDAIARVGFRRWITHRRMLEWTTAQMARWTSHGRLRQFQWHLSLISLLGLAIGATIACLAPANLSLALPWLLLWLINPWIGWWLSRAPSRTLPGYEINSRDAGRLRLIARRTWRYFGDLVGPETSWLPPDNYQVSHQNRLAMRTSPTNIGMWMVSALAARDFGYLTLDQLIQVLAHTMLTLRKLERFEGHLFNWYEIKSLKPLEPRYISSVDSGNLVAALWTLRQGLYEIIAQPVLDRHMPDGLLDTAEALRQASEAEDVDEAERQRVVRLIQKLQQAGPELPARLALLREMQGVAGALAGSIEEQARAVSPSAYWARQLDRQIASWLQLADRYLQWVGELAALDPDERDRLKISQSVLMDAPSLRQLATGTVPGLPAWLQQGQPGGVKGGLADKAWQEHFGQLFATSRWLAGEMLAQSERLASDVENLANEINLGFLYDPDRRLFSVGYNLTEGRLDNAYYDLLASESRLGSYIAIARGDVPLEHWLSLGRPFRSHERHPVLLSWSGTMFEYLMPLLFQRTYPMSLLDKASTEAVELQRDYGRLRRVPWGISESAYGDLDLDKTYQYKAFGVPWLGLKRGLEDDLVVAPYATFLALSLDPQQAIRNLRRLANHGLEGEFGYFEAIDFSRRPRVESERGVIVRAYMAHHQGMSLLALDNLLNADPMPRRFHGDRRIRAVEPLLYERIPAAPAMHHISIRELLPGRLPEIGIAPSIRRFDTPDTPSPNVQLLANGRYGLMLTQAGGGYSRWREFDITRWRRDSTRDHWGSFCYIRDSDSNRIWSVAHQPVAQAADHYEAHFPLDRAEFHRTDAGIETTTEILVTPVDDVEIRRITLVNRSLRVRHLELTSYIELALAPHVADRQHPAFQKLFVETEALAEKGCLLAHRRARAEDDPPIFAAHRLTLSQGVLGEMAFETERRVFIGRGHTLKDPLGLYKTLSNTSGFVLDPIFSLRHSARLAPGERLQLSLVVAAGESREVVLNLMEKYAEPAATERAFELAWASAQLELRLLRIKSDDARRYQQLAGSALFPSGAMRAPYDRLQANRKGQSGLWPYGISGDLPIVLVTISDAQDLDLVREMLKAHTYWHQHGLRTDLVILNEEAGGYDQPIKEQLERMIQAGAIFTGVDQPGGVFLRAADGMPQEDQILFQAAAALSMVAARGRIAQQLGAAFEQPDLPEQLARRSLPEEPSRALPYMDLPYFNSLGGFTGDGREYAIYLGPNTHTPAPWVNVIANPSFGTLVSESGSGFTWSGNSQRNRLTAWSNDPVLDSPSEVVYIRDDETGVFWTPTARPVRERTAYRARHGAGYTVFEHNSHAIEQTYTVFVPQAESGADPVKLGLLRLRNDSARPRKLSVTLYAEWTLGENREVSQQHILTRWDGDMGALLARNRYQPDYPNRLAFAAMSPAAQTYTADRAEFLGRNGSPQAPAGMRRSNLGGLVGANLDPCAALQVRLDLAPGAAVEVVCMLGETDTPKGARQLILKYREPSQVTEVLHATQGWWDDTLGGLHVKTPELSVDFLLNRWLLYQALSCRIWGRSAFYQSGGAFGFRDQLQDVLALVASRPEIAREHILLAASRQFREGDVQHWWHPPGGAGIRSRISDDLLWLPYAVGHYVRLTGDSAILDQQVSFLDTRALEPDELDAYLTPAQAIEQASLFDHCCRAVSRGLTAGPHGLPLMGTGDWNDGLNGVGRGGKGESVWLAWFLIEVLQEMAGLASLVGKEAMAEEYRNSAERLRHTIEDKAWDGDWYLRGTFDDGHPLGSAGNEEARIASLPQSWAWISGPSDSLRARTALDSAWRELVKQDEKLVLLFTPPFDRSRPWPGYIQGYPPGVRENGGQYTHGALWLAVAFARSGDGERAEKILHMLNPVEHAREAEGVWRYAVEPYVATADIYRVPGHLGEGGWSWYTGSAGWMYRAWVEEVLGFQLEGEILRINPTIPGWWKGFDLRYRHGEALYEIRVDDPEGAGHGVAWVEMDGRRVEGMAIPLERDPIKHAVTVRLGKSTGQAR